MTRNFQSSIWIFWPCLGRWPISSVSRKLMVLWSGWSNLRPVSSDSSSSSVRPLSSYLPSLSSLMFSSSLSSSSSISPTSSSSRSSSVIKPATPPCSSITIPMCVLLLWNWWKRSWICIECGTLRALWSSIFRRVILS